MTDWLDPAQVKKWIEDEGKDFDHEGECFCPLCERMQKFIVLMKRSRLKSKLWGLKCEDSGRSAMSDVARWVDEKWGEVSTRVLGARVIKEPDRYRDALIEAVELLLECHRDSHGSDIELRKFLEGLDDNT